MAACINWRPAAGWVRRGYHWEDASCILPWTGALHPALDGRCGPGGWIAEARQLLPSPLGGSMSARQRSPKGKRFGVRVEVVAPGLDGGNARVPGEGIVGAARVGLCPNRSRHSHGSETWAAAQCKENKCKEGGCWGRASGFKHVGSPVTGPLGGVPGGAGPTCCIQNTPLTAGKGRGVWGPITLL